MSIVKPGSQKQREALERQRENERRRKAEKRRRQFSLRTSHVRLIL